MLFDEDDCWCGWDLPSWLWLLMALFTMDVDIYDACDVNEGLLLINLARLGGYDDVMMMMMMMLLIMMM